MLFGTMCHQPWRAGDDQMLQDTGGAALPVPVPLP